MAVNNSAQRVAASRGEKLALANEMRISAAALAWHNGAKNMAKTAASREKRVCSRRSSRNREKSAAISVNRSSS